MALTRHQTPVSRIGAIAIRMVRKLAPGLRLIVSFADPAESHHGGIYQAMGFIYAGTTTPGASESIGPDGKAYLQRQVSQSGVVTQFGKRTKVYRISECERCRSRRSTDTCCRSTRTCGPRSPHLHSPIRSEHHRNPRARKQQAARFPLALGGAAPTRALHLQR